MIWGAYLARWAHWHLPLVSFARKSATKERVETLETSFALALLLLIWFRCLKQGDNKSRWDGMWFLQNFI
jgi:hypothetical protein